MLLYSERATVAADAHCAVCECACGVALWPVYGGSKRSPPRVGLGARIMGMGARGGGLYLTVTAYTARCRLPTAVHATDY